MNTSSTTFTRLTGSELTFSILDDLYSSIIRSDEQEFLAKLKSYAKYLLSERPACMAAINALRDIAVYYMANRLKNLGSYVAEIKEKYDKALWKAAEYASKRIQEGEAVLTNSNSLAVRRVFKVLGDQGRKVKVYITESRPGNEGLLMTEYLESLGFDVYLIVDSATRFFMKDVDKIIVGAESISANGAVVSKVGTSLIALIAKEARKRVFVVAPSYKLSYETIYGELLPLPEKGAEALVSREELEKLPSGYKARVPIYDVTPPEYIDGIFTEYGLIAPQAIPILLKYIYGSYPPAVRPLEEVLEKLTG